MTAPGAGVPETGNTSGPITYWQASSACRHTGAARERHDALSERNSLARATANLKARGEFDPARHGSADVAPLSLAEHLELLATGAVVAHYYRHPASVHHAALAGASWEQIAAALAITQEQARRDYREWAENQHRLWQREGRWGLGDAEYAAAMARTGPAAAEAGQPAVSGGDEDQAAVILSALEDAAAAIRDRAAGCPACQVHPAGLCDETADQLRRAEAYGALAGQLRQEER